MKLSLNSPITVKKTISKLFLTFIFLVLSFGRFFSIIHIGPIYVTEIMLVLVFLLLLENGREILQIPRTFLIFLTAYFILSNIYLLYGICCKNLYALRDIILSGYTLFLPATFIILSDKAKLKVFLWIVVLSNIVGLAINRFWIYQPSPWYPLLIFSSKIKTFNYAFYYAFTLSFLIPLLSLAINTKKKVLIIFLSAFNIYMIAMMAVRSSWLVTLVMLIFIIIFFSKKVFKYMLYIILLLCPISAIFLYIPNSAQLSRSTLKDKVNAFTNFVGGKEKKDGLQDETVNQYYDNITWRFSVWSKAINSGLKNPLFGAGFGRTVFHSDRFKNPLEPRANIQPLHNHVVTLFYKMGFFGLALFLFINIYTFCFGLFYLNQCKSEFIKCFLIGALGSFIQWHGMALFFDLIDSPPTSIFLWIILGLIFAGVNIDKKQLVHNI